MPGMKCRKREEGRPGLIREIVKNKHSYILMLPFMVFCFLFVILPVLISIALSFTDYNMIQPPSFNGFQNYIRMLLDDKIMLIAVRNTLLFAIVIFSIIVPMQTLILPTYAGFKNFDIFGILGLVNTVSGVDLRVNLLDTLWVYILPSLFGMGIRGGLFVFIFRQAFRGMPKELEEAAAIDGCARFKTFYRIMVPMSGSTYLTVFLFSFVWHWNEYFYSTMYMGSVKTLATGLATLSLSLKAVGVQIFDPFELTTRLQAGCFIMIVPLLVMYIFLQKYFVEGVERTGITG